MYRLTFTSLIASLLMCAGCASTPLHQRLDPVVPFDPALLSGVDVFGEPVASSEAPGHDVLAVDQPMNDFLTNNVGNQRVSVARFKRLMNALVSGGYFRGSYGSDLTNTAAQTFSTQSGNCLSYTNLLIALARAIGVNASYQLVKVPPVWDADSGLLIRNNHINVVLHGYRFNKGHSSQFVVDFNVLEPDPKYVREMVSDQYAKSLFYANLGVDAMRQDDQRMAFAHLKRAIELSPNNADLWINLGAFYSVNRAPSLAAQAYEHALVLDAGNKSALSGLGGAYDQLGQAQLAEHYFSRVRRFRDRNPQYHFAVAQLAFEQHRYEVALNALDVAIGLERRNGRFHFLRGLTETQMGKTDAARQSFRRARRYGRTKDLKEKYREFLATR